MKEHKGCHHGGIQRMFHHGNTKDVIGGIQRMSSWGNTKDRIMLEYKGCHVMDWAEMDHTV